MLVPFVSEMILPQQADGLSNRTIRFERNAASCGELCPERLMRTQEENIPMYAAEKFYDTFSCIAFSFLLIAALRLKDFITVTAAYIIMFANEMINILDNSVFIQFLSYTGFISRHSFMPLFLFDINENTIS